MNAQGRDVDKYKQLEEGCGEGGVRANTEASCAREKGRSVGASHRRAAWPRIAHVDARQ